MQMRSQFLAAILHLATCLIAPWQQLGPELILLMHVEFCSTAARNKPGSCRRMKLKQNYKFQMYRQLSRGGPSAAAEEPAPDPIALPGGN